MRIGLLRNPPIYDGNYNTTVSTLGNNTGNLAFWSALEKLFNTVMVPHNTISKELNQKFDKLIITDLIWINETSNFEHLNHLLNVYNNDVIPISVGLQSSDMNLNFKISSKTVDVLKQIQERNVIGVRGEYTATILNKYGIKNVEVIGCPSMYYMNDENFQIVDNVQDNIEFASNFKSFYSKLTIKEKHFLSYCAKHNSFFVEQTHNTFTLEQANNDENYFNYVNNWLKYHSHIYYNIDDWNRCIKCCNFSMGARFHGNVMALRNNIKALFFTCDSRTKELTEFFDLPTIEMESFDNTKDIRYYYDMADYSKFNKTYKSKFKAFKTFLIKNGLDLNK